jgi:hypothetical protein
MKLKDAGTRGPTGGRRPPPGGIGLRGDIRMEWMDPLSWRLPSGKALAEFALQAGFLAPLMLVGPRYKKPKKGAGPGVGRTVDPQVVDQAVVDRAVVNRATDKQFTEVPGRSGSFRDFRETGF